MSEKELADAAQHTGSSRAIRSVALGADGQVFVVSIWDGYFSRLVAYDTNSGQVLWSKNPDSLVDSLSVSSIANQASATFHAFTCEQQHLQRWDLHNGRDLAPLADRGISSSLLYEQAPFATYTEDGTCLLAATSGEIRAWNSQTGKNVFGISPPQFEDRGERIYSIALSANNKYLAGAADHGVLLWDVDTRKYLRRFGRPPLSPARHILLSPEGKYLYVDPGISAPLVFDTASGKIVRTFGPKDYAAPQLTPDGSFVIISPTEIRTWSPKTNEFSKPLARKTAYAFVLKSGEIWGFDPANGVWERDPTKPRTLTLINDTTGKDIQQFTLPGRYQ